MYKYLKSWVIDSNAVVLQKKEKKLQKKKDATPTFTICTIENKTKEKSQKQKAQMKSYAAAVMTEI